MLRAGRVSDLVTGGVGQGNELEGEGQGSKAFAGDTTEDAFPAV